MKYEIIQSFLVNDYHIVQVANKYYLRLCCRKHLDIIPNRSYLKTTHASKINCKICYILFANLNMLGI